MSDLQPDGLYCIAQDAERLLNGFLKIADSWTEEGECQIAVRTNVGGLAVNGAYKPRSANIQVFQQFLSEVKDRPTIICQSGEIYFRPPSLNNQEWNQRREESCIKYETSNGVVGRFIIRLSQAQDFIPRAIQLLEKQFPISSYIDIARSESSSIDQAGIQLRERSVADLQGQVAKLAEFLTRMAEREAKSREKLQTKLNADHETRKETLDAEYRQRKEEFEQLKTTQESELDAKRKALQDERDAFDLRSEQGVRRELLTQIQSVLQDAEKHSASPDTQKKRGIIHKVVTFLLVIGITGAGFSGHKIFSSQGNVDWHYWLLLASATLTIITTSIYYLKWNDRWFREHADAEFAAKRYKADILRASWLAELAGEWKKTKSDIELSPLLIEAFARNLFANVSASDPSEHPMDEMTSLLKRASEVNFGKAGFSLKGITKPSNSDT